MHDYIFILQLILGFVLLVKGADLLVDHAARLAYGLGMSQFLVGVIVVSVGTSLPELMVAIYSSFQGETGELIFGNVIGSNMANVLLVIGILTIFYPVTIEWKMLKRDWIINVLILLLLFLLFNLRNFSLFKQMELSRWDSTLLLLGFFGYCFFLLKNYKKLHLDEEISLESEPNDIHWKGRTKHLILILISSIMVSLGGKFVVDGSLAAADLFQLSEGFVGFTIIAIGTSLPELITSLAAGKKNFSKIALGNILGSSIFNILWILGVSASIKPINLPAEMNLDIAICFSSLLLFGLLIKIKSPLFNYQKGIPLVASYIIYLAFLFWRG